MSKTQKPTAQERQSYGGMYPLHRWVIIDGHRCALEDLRGSWSKPDPVWELLAPDGYHFDEWLHSILGDTQTDAIDRAGGLEPCNEHCGG